MRGQAVQTHSQDACNSLHTNKMQRPSRKSKPSNIIEILPQESTIELRMEAIDFTTKALPSGAVRRPVAGL
jgi:hypothetical protein